MRISVINHTRGALSDREVLDAIRAVNEQIARDFAPYWHRFGELRLEGHMHSKKADEKHTDMRGDAIIYIWDKVDPEEAVGYHELSHAGTPYGFVFLEMATALDEPWSVTLSHEALEMLMDPEINLLVAGPHPTEDREVLYWYEVCDAVQAQTYEILGQTVSNFVLPLYFTQNDEFDGRNDFLGERDAGGEPLESFGVAEGGYVGYYDPKTGKHKTHFERRDSTASKRAEIKREGRGARRAVRYQLIGSDAGVASRQTRERPSSPRRAFRVEGPWNIGSPVHEVMALLAVKTAIESLGNSLGDLLKKVDTTSLPRWSSRGAHNLWTDRLHRGVQQFVRGVIWPDDPEGLFFDEPLWTEDFDDGIGYLRAYKKDPGDARNLTARTHHGDLQFLHAMDREGTAAKTTRKKILDWARCLIDVACGRLSPDETLRSVPALARMFHAKKHRAWTVRKLFGCGSSRPRDLFIRQRALGALLHLVQDSAAAGHVSRERDTLLIEQFHSYESQDHGHHRECDEWANGRTLADRVRNTRGATEAVAWSGRIVALVDAGRPTRAILDYLEREVFALSPNAIPAGPGEHFH